MSYVYVIAVGGEDGPFQSPVKIGMTDNPDARLADIRPCSPLGISFSFLHRTSSREVARSLERAAHGFFRDQLISYEWFDVDPDLAAEIITKLSQEEVA